jgi:hydrogenase maturation protease
MLIIGCGNRDRGDDGAGAIVTERLREFGMGTEICTGEAFSLIEAWNSADDVIVVDTMVTGAAAGTVRLWDATQAEFQGSLSTSTHGFGLAEAIELARALGHLPQRLCVYGIEGRCFDIGSDISPEVLRAVEEVAKRLTTEAIPSR